MKKASVAPYYEYDQEYSLWIQKTWFQVTLQTYNGYNFQAL